MSDSAPKKKAIEISQMLNAVLGNDRFPVNVQELIFEYTSQQVDPVTKIKKVSLDGFEGMLRPSSKRNEWHILYNEDSVYRGRERFTLAHELCHYLLDRTPLHSIDQPRDTDLNFQCNPLERHLWETAEAQREENADIFASYLLMPIDDFRNQTQKQVIDIDLFRHVTDRYGVSLTAAMLKWIEFTDQKAVMIVSRDGFALWGRSSANAYKNGAFVRSGMEIPSEALTHNSAGTDGKMIAINPDVWQFSPRTIVTHEMAVISHKLDLCISVLLLTDNDKQRFSDIDHSDSYDHFSSF